MRSVVVATNPNTLCRRPARSALGTFLAVGVLLAGGSGCLGGGKSDDAAAERAPEKPSTESAAARRMFVSPGHGDTVRGIVRWEARAPAADVRAIDFFVDGARRWREEEAPYVFNGDEGTWDTTVLANGPHELRLVVTRGDGMTERAEITVTVANPPRDTTPPVAPSALRVTSVGATSLSVTWRPGGRDGVSGYRVYANDRLVLSTPETSVTLSWLPCDTSHALGVVSLDRTGNWSNAASVRARTAACEAASIRPLYVDGESRGGACDDTREPGDVAFARPWCSLPRAVEAASAGSVVFVRGGSYPKLELRGDHGRSRSVTIRPYPSETVRLAGAYLADSSHLRLTGLRITGRVTLADGTRDVALVGNDLSPYGVQMKGVERILIERNRIHDLAPRDELGNCSCAISAQPSDEHGLRDVIVRGNRVARTSDDGIQIARGYGIVIEGNTVTDALSIGDGSHVDSLHVLGGDGFVIRDNRFQRNQHGLMFTDFAAFNVAIENNVVADIDTGYALNAGDIPNAVIVNNTFWGSRYGVIIRDDDRDAPKPEGIVFLNNVVDHQRSGRAPFARHDYNLVAEGSTYGAHDMISSTRFVDAAAGDFRLAPGSPGLDAGTRDGAPLFDRNGRPRRNDAAAGAKSAGRNPDIGADER